MPINNHAAVKSIDVDRNRHIAPRQRRWQLRIQASHLNAAISTDRAVNKPPINKQLYSAHNLYRAVKEEWNAIFRQKLSEKTYI